jgi:DNA-binding MarR family transcriptional regulator
MRGRRQAESGRRRVPWRFVYLLSVAHRRLQAFVRERADGHSATRAGLLMAISPERGAAMSSLGATLDLAPPGISNLVERAREAGLLERHVDPEDARAFRLTLTRSGEEARRIAVAEARRLNERLCEGFTEAELAIVARWLEAFTAKFPHRRGEVREEKER